MVEQLQELYQKALKEVGEANAAIFEIHQMMLDDGDYNESVENIIETQKGAFGIEWLPEGKGDHG